MEKKKIAESTRLEETSELTESEPWPSPPCQLCQGAEHPGQSFLYTSEDSDSDTHSNV